MPSPIQKTRAYKDNISLLTYEKKESNINPITREYRSEKPYPYEMWDELSEEQEEVVYESLVIENDYLKVTVLPALGGRLYSAFDKRNGADIFYCNRVIKPQLVGLTGAWFSGGIEFNFPIGHRPTTMEVVESNLRENADGSASIFIGETDNISGLRFSVELRLQPGKAVIEQNVTIHNPTPLPWRCFFWSTASYPETENLECRYPTHWMVNEQNRKRGLWPFDDGIDVRWAGHIRKFSSIFAAMSDDDFFGLYDGKLKRGTVHVAPHRAVPGRKYWSWGQSELAGQWQRVLTDEDGPYLEHQTGTVETQNEYREMQPFQTLSWTEHWFQAIETGSFTYANEHVIINTQFSQNGAEASLALALSLQLNEVVQGGHLQLIHAGNSVFEAKGDWDPSKTVHFDTTLHHSCLTEGTLRLVLSDADGEELVNYVVRESQQIGEELDEPADIQAEDDISGRLFNIKKQEERLRFRGTEALYEQLIADNPDYAEAYVRKAITQMKMLRFKEAADTMLEALKIAPLSDEVFYYAGLAESLQGNVRLAKQRLLQVNGLSVYAAPASILLGKLALRQRDPHKAADYFAMALRDPVRADTAKVLQVYSRRMMGKDQAAKKSAAELLLEDPLNIAAAFEYDQLFNTKHSAELIRGDVHNTIRLVEFYSELGDREGQEAALNQHPNQKHPLILYHWGYFHALGGDGEKAKSVYLEAEKQSRDRVFPIASLSLDALEDTVRRLGVEALTAHYYRGLIYNAKERLEDARESWGVCVQADWDYSVVYRNLGSLVRDLGDINRAVDVLEMGLHKQPINQEIAILLNSLYKQLGYDEKRSSLLPKSVDPSTLSQLYARMTISIYNDMQQYDKALDILSQYRFRNWENEFFVELNLKRLYSDTRLGIARKAMAEGNWDEAIRQLQLAAHYPENLQLGISWDQSFAQLNFLLAVCHERKGDFSACLASCNDVIAEQIQRGAPAFDYYVKAMNKKVELEWLGFEAAVREN